MDPSIMSGGGVSFATLALKLVVGAPGMIDKTVAAYDEATGEGPRATSNPNVLYSWDAEDVSSTKDRGFKKQLSRRVRLSQATIREPCNALGETFNTLTHLTAKMNGRSLYPLTRKFWDLLRSTQA